MNGLQGFAVEEATKYEVLSAWTVPATVVPGVASGTGWQTLGEYYLPGDVDARLDCTGLVSASGLTMTMRLWDTVTKQAVPGSVEISSQVPQRKLGPRVSLAGLQTYQVQVQVVGAAGDDKFGVVDSATITD